MSPYSFIIPAITAVSFFMFIFMSQRVWLPRAGTTEWITRRAFPVQMSFSSISGLKWSDLFYFVCIGIIYGSIAAILNMHAVPSSFWVLLRAGCAGLAAGFVFLTGRLLFGNFGGAILSAIFAIADVSLLSAFLSADVTGCIMIVLIAAYSFTVCLSAKHPLWLIPSGLILGGAMFCNPGCIVFILFGAVVVLCSAQGGKKQRFWMFPLFDVLLPCLVYCLMSYFISGRLIPRFSLAFAYHTIDPVYLGCAAVCLFITLIHIFRDKSFSALFASAGVLASVGAAFLGIPAIGLFSGLVMAYSGNIIIKRGKSYHKFFAILFAVIICLGLLSDIFQSVDLLDSSAYEFLRKLSAYRIYLH